MNSGTYTIIRVTGDENLSSPLSANIWCDLFEFAGCALPLDFRGLFSSFVLEQSSSVLPSSEYELGIVLRCLNDLLLDIQVDWCFDSAHEPSSHVDAFSAQAQSGCKTLPICETSRCNERHIDGLSGSAKENEVGDIRLANVASTLEAVNAQEINAKLDRALRMSDGGTLVENYDTNSLQHLDDWARRVSSRLDNLNSLIDNHLCVRAIIRGVYRRKESNVDTERIVGHGPASSDFFSEIFGSWLCEGSEDTKSSCITDGGCELSISNPLHATLDDGNCWLQKSIPVCDRI